MHVAGDDSVDVLRDRHRELRVLEEAMRECGAGASRTVLVEGGAGCGKTELLAAVAARAAALDGTVLRAGTSRLRDRRPYGTIRHLARWLSLHGPGPVSPAGGEPEAALGDLTPADGPASPVPEAVQAFVDRVQRLATESLVVILVDDLQYADAESSHLLLASVASWETARVLLVFSELPHVQPIDPTLATDLLRQPNFSRIRLGVLDRAAVAAVVGTQRDGPGDERLVEAAYEGSGGNPLLLRALLDEYRVSSSPPTHEIAPVPGGSFSHAVLTCLHRSGPAATEVAGALAVLGGTGTVRLVSQLLQTRPAVVVQGLRVLEAAGLAVGSRLSCPVRVAVLDGMGDERRTDLHRRAAVLLHGAGAASSAIAHHLLAARQTAEAWEITALEDAAQQALAEDDWQLAAAYLELAHDGCTDPPRRTRIKVDLAFILWRVNPSAAERHVIESLAAARAHRLPPPAAATLAKLLVSHGLIEEALEVLDEGDVRPDADSPRGVRHGIAMLWARFSYPQVADGVPRPPVREADGTEAHEPALVAPQLQSAMASWLSGSSADRAMRTAEQFLEVSPLTDGSLSAITSAVKMLLHSGRPDRAIRWCDRFLDEAERRELPGWVSVFTAVRAWALLHQGKLAEAVLFGEKSLSVVPEWRGCVFLGGAMATLVTAYTAMGRQEAAANYLRQPVPDTLFRSAFGLGYLRARGRYSLGTDRPHAALADFLRVGEMAQRWGVDHPTLVPWRSDAAEAWLRLEEPEQAARLLHEERVRSSGTAYIHGVVLRLLAATVEPEQRPALLTQAVEELQASGDRLELARALADLGDAHHGLGDVTRAATIRRRAWHMARDCGAQPLCARLAPDGAVPGGRRGGFTPASGGGELGALAKLTNSERRVAALAACGHTNQEISVRLYITVSTVEQHLTRVYRKLQITCREELPADLQHQVDEIA